MDMCVGDGMLVCGCGCGCEYARACVWGASECMRVGGWVGGVSVCGCMYPSRQLPQVGPVKRGMTRKKRTANVCLSFTALPKQHVNANSSDN